MFSYHENRSGGTPDTPPPLGPFFCPYRGLKFSPCESAPEIVEALQRPPQGADMDVEQGGNVRPRFPGIEH